MARPEPEQAKDDGMSEILREFLVESNENLDSLDRKLVILEKDPDNRETLFSECRRECDRRFVRFVYGAHLRQ